MSALKQTHGEEIKFGGIGGEMMQAQGLNSLFPMSELSVMGISEVLPHLPRLLQRISETVRAIDQAKPDALITIDAPDFSLRVAKKLKGRGIPLIHYVAPSVWVWKPKRAKRIAAFLDHLLTLLPFEPPYFEKEGLPASFVGHSVTESGAGDGDGQAFRQSIGLDQDAPLLCVLPGSRRSETSKLLPIITQVITELKRDVPDLAVAIPVIEHVAGDIRQATKDWPVDVHMVDNEAEKFNVFAASTAALAASGTVALELALANTPHVTIYKMNPITSFMARLLVKTRYANLINILADQEIVPELVLTKCRADLIAPRIKELLVDNDVRRRQLDKFPEILSKLTNTNERPSVKAAQVVLEIIAEHVKLKP
jgi:lipid-A-disaccharide synthase